MPADKWLGIGCREYMASMALYLEESNQLHYRGGWQDTLKPPYSREVICSGQVNLATV